MAFWLSYIVFKREFFRKEKDGLIRPFKKKPHRFGTMQVVAFCVLAFTVGYKLVYCVQHYSLFSVNPASILFSWNGNAVAGFLATAVYLTWQWFSFQKKKPVHEHVDNLVHPYEVTDSMLLWCAVTGFAGALLFAKLEYLAELFVQPAKYLTSFNGLNFLGGFIFGAGIYLYRTKKMGIPFLVAADIGSPGIMLAYGLVTAQGHIKLVFTGMIFGIIGINGD